MSTDQPRDHGSAGVGPGSSAEVRGRVRGGAGIRPLLPLAAVVVALLGGLWVLSRSSGEQASPPVTTSPDSVPPTGPVAGDGEAAPVPGPVPADPVVGEETGLVLFYGGDAPLQRLDLDTGALSPFGLRAHPVLVTGPSLVLYQEASDRIGWVPLDDPGQQVRTWKRGFVAATAADPSLTILDPEAEPEPEQIRPGLGTGVWETYLTTSYRSTGRFPADLHPEVDADEAAAPPLGGAARVLRPYGPLSSRPDGVYLPIVDDEGELTDLRVADGRVLAYDREVVDQIDHLRALVGTCGPAGPCELSWLDLSTGEPVELPVPEVGPRRATMVGDERWLHTIGWDGRSELLELATGRRIEHDWETARPALSPDARWMAELRDGAVVVTDVAADSVVATIRDFELEGSGTLLFAPSG